MVERKVILQIDKEDLQEVIKEVVNKLIQGNETRPQPDEMITRQEACKRLNVCLSTIDLWIKKGLLPYVKVGRRVLLQRADVVELLTKNKMRYEK
ncbi:MAG: helix-turn-helix domain-containing protein [Bacteroidales bacterium]|nr:helix-turn-helix domain-containing protein [Bacteroidales bacterium]MDY6423623.1 helix-turn-helix domain-containing protein [Bacteroidales bacterium]